MKISIIIPTFNYANYILEALESIERQTYSKNLIEVIVIDDGSTDETPQLFEHYQSKFDVRYHYQNNQGKAAATQKGIDLSTGEIIFNLDADDYFYPNKIEEVVKVFQEHPNVTHIGHPADVLQESEIKYSEHIDKRFLNRPIKGIKLLTDFLEKRQLFGGGSTFSGRAEVLKKTKIPPRVDMYIDEYLIYATTVSGASYFIQEPLSVWRVHGKNYSVDKSKEILKEKNKRLLSSSEGMLAYICNSNLFSQQIIQFYELKHLDRLYSSKEKNNEKGINDFFKLIVKIISLKYSLSALHTYRIFYRLVPSFILNRLRNVR